MSISHLVGAVRNRPPIEEKRREEKRREEKRRDAPAGLREGGSRTAPTTLPPLLACGGLRVNVSRIAKVAIRNT